MDLGSPSSGVRQYADDEVRYDALKSLREIMEQARKANDAEEHEVAKRAYDALAAIPLKCRTQARFAEEYEKAREAVFGPPMTATQVFRPWSWSSGPCNVQNVPKDDPSDIGAA
jgi:hypothetical protein